LHLVGILFPHINDDARSKSHQISMLSVNSFNKNSFYMTSDTQFLPIPPFTSTCFSFSKPLSKASCSGRSYAHYLPNDSCRNRSQARRGGFQCCQTGRGHSH